MSKLHSWEASQSFPPGEATHFHCMVTYLGYPEESDSSSSSLPSSPTFPGLKHWEIPWDSEYKARLCPSVHCSRQLTSALNYIPKTTTQQLPSTSPAASSGEKKKLKHIASSTSVMFCRPGMETEFIWRQFSKLAMNAEVTFHSRFDEPLK